MSKMERNPSVAGLGNYAGVLHCSESRRSIGMQCLVIPIRSAPGKMQDARSMTNREVAVVIVFDQLIVLWPLLVQCMAFHCCTAS